MILRQDYKRVGRGANARVRRDADGGVSAWLTADGNVYSYRISAGALLEKRFRAAADEAAPLSGGSLLVRSGGDLIIGKENGQ